MLTWCDKKYKSRTCFDEVGYNGACSDAGIFQDIDLKSDIEEVKLGMPEPEPLPGDNQNMPFFIIADYAFALPTWLMKPYCRRTITREEIISIIDY